MSVRSNAKQVLDGPHNDGDQTEGLDSEMRREFVLPFSQVDDDEIEGDLFFEECHCDSGSSTCAHTAAVKFENHVQ